MASNEILYKSVKWYENLLFNIEVILKFAEKEKNAVNSGLKYFGKKDFRKRLDKKYNMEVAFVYILLFLAECFCILFFGVARLAFKVVDNRIIRLRHLLKKGGHPGADNW